MNVYSQKPTYETRSFLLRVVEKNDAADLLECYSDPAAVARMNADRCTNDFYYKTIDEMQSALDFWIDSYEKGYFVRFAIISKAENRAAGTVEMFGGEFGVLRIDLMSKYETRESIIELTALAVCDLIRDFEAKKLYVRADNTPERAKVYADYGFRPAKDFRPEVGYMEYLPRGMAYCGLACDLCSENAECPGCRAKGCFDKDTCVNFNCCSEKGLMGCWECPEFPCGKGLLANPRMRAFCECADELGEDELLRRLFRNRAAGIVYHESGKLTGDYDKFTDTEDIKNLVKRGIESRDC